MKITSLNCGTFCPPNLSRLLGDLEPLIPGALISPLREKLSGIPYLGERLRTLPVDPTAEKAFASAFRELVTHVLLIEMENHLILIDTGVGRKQMLELGSTLKGRLSGLLMGLQADPGQTAVAQMKKAGYSPSDVTDVILTHLDTDHVGGLCDFPQARAHLFRTELESANHPRNRFEKLRFLKHLWENHEHFELYEGGDGRGGSGEVFHDVELTPLRGIPEELMLLALPGHTAGHSGVYLRSRNFLFAGDACVNEVVLKGGYLPAPVRFYQAATTTAPAAWNRSIQQLKNLCACGVTVCCAHDRRQFEQHAEAFKSL